MAQFFRPQGSFFNLKSNDRKLSLACKKGRIRIYFVGPLVGVLDGATVGLSAVGAYVKTNSVGFRDGALDL